MTSWQDQPPLTRRQARELERSREDGGSATPQNPQAEPSEPPQAVPVTPAPQPQSRRVSTSEPTTGGERPNVATVAPPRESAMTTRPPMPNYSQAFGAATLTAPTAIAPAPAAPALAAPAPAAPAESFRPRSFAPETRAEVRDGADAESDAIPQRTLTRRELRAMLAAQELEEAPAPSAIASPPVAELVEPQVADDAASRRVTWTPPAPEAPERPVWAPIPPVAEEFDSSDRSRASDVVPPKPVGHWSVDADEVDLDDAAGQSFDQLISRGGSGGVATTTSALILPSIPQGREGSVALTTGEILVTGSFDLPRSLGSTGAHPDRIDGAEIDDLFDFDEESTTTGAQPIRASRAVSSHTSTRDVLVPPKKESRWSVPFVLTLAGGVLLVSVVALVVAGFVAGVF